MASANVVGYQTYDASQTDYMSTIGVAFKNITAADGSFTFGDTMFGRAVEDGDQFMLWDNDAYNLIIYTYYDGYGWSVMDAEGNESMVEGNTIEIAKGQVLWYLPVTPENVITVSGQLEDAGTQTIEFVPNDENGYCFSFVNPFPVDTKFSDLSAFCGDGDQFLLWDNNAYNLIIYTYYDGYGWSVMDAEGNEDMAAETDIAIPAGQGAYFLPCDAREWSVTFNY